MTDVVLGATTANDQAAHTPIDKINIGTRKSQLAIAQVDSIIAQLKAVAPQPEYVSRVVSTMADENQVKAFSAFDSKSIWTEELEKLLMEGGLDVVVHCLKGRCSAMLCCDDGGFVDDSSSIHPTPRTNIY